MKNEQIIPKRVNIFDDDFAEKFMFPKNKQFISNGIFCLHRSVIHCDLESAYSYANKNEAFVSSVQTNTFNRIMFHDDISSDTTIMMNNDKVLCSDIIISIDRDEYRLLYAQKQKKFCFIGERYFTFFDRDEMYIDNSAKRIFQMPYGDIKFPRILVMSYSKLHVKNKLRDAMLQGKVSNASAKLTAKILSKYFDKRLRDE